MYDPIHHWFSITFNSSSLPSTRAMKLTRLTLVPLRSQLSGQTGHLTLEMMQQLLLNLLLMQSEILSTTYIRDDLDRRINSFWIWAAVHWDLVCKNAWWYSLRKEEKTTLSWSMVRYTPNNVWIYVLWDFSVVWSIPNIVIQSSITLTSVRVF